METAIATYQATPEKHGRGTYFFTDCGHSMYSVKGDIAYHGCLCPGCFSRGKETVLYIRGSKEANEYLYKMLNESQVSKASGC